MSTKRLPFSDPNMPWKHMLNHAVRCKRGEITEQAFLQEIVQVTITELHELGWKDKHIVYYRQQGDEAFGKAFPEILRTLHDDSLFRFKRCNEVLLASGLEPANLPPQPGVIAGYTWYQLRPIWDTVEKEMIARAERELRAVREQVFREEMRATPPRRVGPVSLAEILSPPPSPVHVGKSGQDRNGVDSHKT